MDVITHEDRKYFIKNLPVYQTRLAANKTPMVGFLIFDDAPPVSAEVRPAKMSREAFISTLPLVPQED